MTLKKSPMKMILVTHTTSWNEITSSYEKTILSTLMSRFHHACSKWKQTLKSKQASIKSLNKKSNYVESRARFDQGAVCRSSSQVCLLCGSQRRLFWSKTSQFFKRIYHSFPFPTDKWIEVCDYSWGIMWRFQFWNFWWMHCHQCQISENDEPSFHSKKFA